MPRHSQMEAGHSQFSRFQASSLTRWETRLSAWNQRWIFELSDSEWNEIKAWLYVVVGGVLIAGNREAAWNHVAGTSHHFHGWIHAQSFTSIKVFCTWADVSNPWERWRSRKVSSNTTRKSSNANGISRRRNGPSCEKERIRVSRWLEQQHKEIPRGTKHWLIFAVFPRFSQRLQYCHGGHREHQESRH